MQSVLKILLLTGIIFLDPGMFGRPFTGRFVAACDVRNSSWFPNGYAPIPEKFQTDFATEWAYCQKYN